MKGITCRKCVNLRNGWCEEAVYSPDPDMEKDCVYYRAATKGDRLREMSDEELASWASSVETDGRAFGPKGKAAWLDLLRQEAD